MLMHVYRADEGGLYGTLRSILIVLAERGCTYGKVLDPIAGGCHLLPAPSHQSNDEHLGRCQVEQRPN